MKSLLLTCKKATLFIEKRHNSALSFTEKIQLRLHLLVCEACKRYYKHSLLLENWLRLGKQETPPSEQETEALKQKILNLNKE